ncbi:MAG: hypothetical protein K8R67_09725, partial [Desulfobacteraceae bacterium]|nr:hypothetical protein [Desulfobacteraceae bacterium]
SLGSYEHLITNMNDNDTLIVFHDLNDCEAGLIQLEFYLIKQQNVFNAQLFILNGVDNAVRLIKEKKNLPKQDIKAIDTFISQGMTNNFDTGCTTYSIYRIQVNDILLTFSDYSCQWWGFNKMTNQLFGEYSFYE